MTGPIYHGYTETKEQSKERFNLKNCKYNMIQLEKMLGRKKSKQVLLDCLRRLNKKGNFSYTNLARSLDWEIGYYESILYPEPHSGFQNDQLDFAGFGPGGVL